jgi:hypothetical protein
LITLKNVVLAIQKKEEEKRRILKKGLEEMSDSDFWCSSTSPFEV